MIDDGYPPIGAIVAWSDTINSEPEPIYFGTVTGNPLRGMATEREALWCLDSFGTVRLVLLPSDEFPDMTTPTIYQRCPRCSYTWMPVPPSMSFAHRREVDDRFVCGDCQDELTDMDLALEDAALAAQREAEEAAAEVDSLGPLGWAP